VSEVRQRWRLVFGRGEEARYLSHLDTVRAWERAFRRGDIPVAVSEGFSPRSKLVFAAPLQLGMLAEHELADLYLAERLSAPDLRDRLAAGLPRGYRVVDLYDVWIGEPALAPQLVAADYRMTLLGVEMARAAAATSQLMAADKLPRERRKEAQSIPYDLRPLLLDLRVRPADGGAIPPDAVEAAATGVWMRLRHSQNLGSGRTDEVIRALAEELGVVAHLASGPDDDGRQVARAVEPADDTEADVARPALEIVRPVRERLWLAEELAV
jgi:radical SAM-linked protein